MSTQTKESTKRTELQKNSEAKQVPKRMANPAQPFSPNLITTGS